MTVKDDLKLTKEDKMQIIRFSMKAGIVSSVINWAFVYLVIRGGLVEFIIAESVFIFGLFIGYRQALKDDI